MATLSGALGVLPCTISLHSFGFVSAGGDEIAFGISTGGTIGGRRIVAGGTVQVGGTHGAGALAGIYTGAGGGGICTIGGEYCC